MDRADTNREPHYIRLQVRWRVPCRDSSVQLSEEDLMRYEVYDEEGKLFRKFWERHEAEKFLQMGWTLVTKAKHRESKPTTETHGIARW